MSEKLTLLIPAKKESESLPFVLKDILKYNYRVFIILDKKDHETINSIKKNFKSNKINILYQKNHGYGDALRLGIKSCKTKYFCIFNADGSFQSKEIIKMTHKLEKSNADFVFASRYENNCSSEDDTITTRIGNYIFTFLGNLLFNLNITDILYTFVLGKTNCAQKINFKSNDFRFCVELPIKAKKMKMKLITSKSNEKKRIAGKKKVNEFRDGFLILSKMIILFLKKNEK